MIDAKHDAVRLECGMSLDMTVRLKRVTVVHVAEPMPCIYLHMHGERQQSSVDCRYGGFLYTLLAQATCLDEWLAFRHSLALWTALTTSTEFRLHVQS